THVFRHPRFGPHRRASVNGQLLQAHHSHSDVYVLFLESRPKSCSKKGAGKRPGSYYTPFNLRCLLLPQSTHPLPDGWIQRSVESSKTGQGEAQLLGEGAHELKVLQIQISS